MQDLEPHDGKPRDPADVLPLYGRAGHGTASIVPHLYRQQQINDKPAAEDVPRHDRPSGERLSSRA
jgi:hypothetical protein